MDAVAAEQLFDEKMLTADVHDCSTAFLDCVKSFFVFVNESHAAVVRLSVSSDDVEVCLPPHSLKVGIPEFRPVFSDDGSTPRHCGF